MTNISVKGQFVRKLAYCANTNTHTHTHTTDWSHSPDRSIGKINKYQLSANVLQTKVDAQCDKFATEPSRQRFASKVANFQLPQLHLMYPHLHLARWGWPRFSFAEIFDVIKRDSLGYRVALFAWSYVYRFSKNIDLWQTDGQTDMTTTNTRVSYSVSRVKSSKDNLRYWTSFARVVWKWYILYYCIGRLQMTKFDLKQFDEKLYQINTWHPLHSFLLPL